MSVTHINRQKKTYHLHWGTTKKGNIKYHFSLKPEGNLVKTVPEGYEIYENPNAQVFLRRIKPQLITSEERELVEQGVKTLAQIDRTIVDIKGKMITVYTVNRDVGTLENVFGSIFGARTSQFDFDRYLRYTAMMRFTLHDKKQRLFVCERYNFRGSIDDWMQISGVEPLAKLVQTYARHLGSESFYELY